MYIKTQAAALALAGAIAMITPAAAAPVMSSTATLKQAGGSDVIQVRRWGRAAAGAGIGLAAGAIIGSAIANSNRAYYGPYGYYDGYYDGAYAYSPGYAPGYVAPGPRYYGGGINNYCGRVDSSGVTRFDNCY